MKNHVPVLTLPWPSSNATETPHFVHDGGSVEISAPLDRGDGSVAVSGFRFEKVRAVRQRAELYCTAWHIRGAMDTVVEIGESDWVAELRSAAPQDQRSQWTMRHFLVYLDSFGCLEVVGESVVPLEEST